VEITFSPKALDHLSFWKKAGNKAVQKKIYDLIESLHTYVPAGALTDLS